MNFLRALLDSPRGTGADRQIAAYQQRENMQDVFRLLLDETMRGVETNLPTRAAFREPETEANLAAVGNLREAETTLAAREAFSEAETETKLPAIKVPRRTRISPMGREMEMDQFS